MILLHFTADDNTYDPMPSSEEEDFNIRLNHFPCKISNVFSSIYEHCSYEELICIGRTLNFGIDKHCIEEIERRTQKQANCEEWFNFRRGRITGCIMKEMCSVRSSVSNRSLIFKICHGKNVTSPAIRWGKMHEEVSSKE